MGGYGSGLYGNGGKRGKRSVESCRSINIRTLQKKAFALGSFVWEWRDQHGELTGAVAMKVLEGGLQIRYKANGAIVNVKIMITETAAGFGSVQWFLCPVCGERRAILYLIDGRFACRICHNLNYRSSQAKDELEYYHWQLMKLCKQLKAEYDPVETFPPERPSGMHGRTYGKIYLKYRELAKKRDEAWIRGAGVILKKIESSREPDKT